MNESKITEALKKKAYLIGKTLCYSKFEPSFPDEHTFCVFCWSRIGGWEEDLHDGYFESESQSWVCDICLEEYEQPFEWRVENRNNVAWQRLLKNNSFDIEII